MITIGVYLNAKPQEGGTYQYHLSIIKALLSLDPTKYKIVSFSLDQTWQNVLPKDFTQIYVTRTELSRWAGGFYRIFDRSDENLVHFASVFNPIIGAIDKSDCELVIFPAQDTLSYQAHKKSLAVIHDLMHRYETHFEEYQDGEYALREKHFKAICKYANGILVDSNVGKQQVIESYGRSPSSIYVLPFVPPNYLLNSQYVDVKSKFGLPERYVFYPAQFWEHKNHLKLIEAIKILHGRGVEVKLVLAGSKKNSYQKVLDKVSELGLTGSVFLLGYISNDDIYSLYKSAVALVFVSLLGPTNIPPVEAMLLGCPVIASNVYAMPEQIGEGGMLIDPQDANDIADKIEHVWVNEETRIDLIEKGQAQVGKWSQNDFNARLQRIIIDMIAV